MKRHPIHLVCGALLFLVASHGCAARQSRTVHAQAASVLRIGMTELPMVGDPFAARDRSEMLLCSLIYQPLFRDEPFAPVLAGESWTRGDSVFVILRKGISFHDGRPLTARDVVLSYRGLIDSMVSFEPNPYCREVAHEVRWVQAQGDTIIFGMRSGLSAPLEHHLTLPIVPAHVFDRDGRAHAVTDLRDAVGTGWQLRQFLFGRGLIRLVAPERNADGISEIELHSIPSDLVRMSAARAGALDFILDLAPAQRIAFRDDPRILVIPYRSPLTTTLVVNCESPFLAEPRVREAISCAIDRRWMMEELLFGMADDIGAPEISFDVHDEAMTDTSEPAPFDLLRTQELLAEAGLRRNAQGKYLLGNREVSLRLVSGGANADDRPMVHAIAEQLRMVFDVEEVEIQDRRQLETVLRRAEFDLYFTRVEGRGSEAMRGQFHSEDTTTPSPARDGAQNWGRFRDPITDRLIEEGVSCPSMIGRRDLEEALRRRLAERRPHIPLFREMEFALLHSERFRLDGSAPSLAHAYPLAGIEEWIRPR